ncbi:TIGR03915 family putative DNA repair protein [bacterium 210820-DFI.6.37]|nr:TIGR03915 family putative DNA repair protein [bacterium 210820-DFI.6.37]
MVDYLYDGTFEGLLTCIYHHYYTEKASGIFHREEYQSTMLGGFMEVETDEKWAVTVYEAIQKKISPYDLKRIYKVFMSDTERKECRILNYVRLGFVKGPSIRLMHGDPIVYPVQQAEQKVNAEVHRLKGLIRFSELEDRILYSPIEPDHDVIEFLAEHFSDRFKNEPFIIHDVKRSKALVAYQGSWYISFFTKENLLPLSEEERDYRRLWKQYFETMAIRERINPRCQKNMMPVRYWKNLTEFQL